MVYATTTTTTTTTAWIVFIAAQVICFKHTNTQQTYGWLKMLRVISHMGNIKHGSPGGNVLLNDLSVWDLLYPSPQGENEQQQFWAEHHGHMQHHHRNPTCSFHSQSILKSENSLIRKHPLFCSHFRHTKLYTLYVQLPCQKISVLKPRNNSFSRYNNCHPSIKTGNWCYIQRIQ